MFTKPLNENKIPPNFLNSLLTNDSLYSMFKNEYDENIEYFQGLKKDEYLYSMLKFITDKLYSGNLFQIYDDEDVEIKLSNSPVLKYIRKFYDDFMLPLIKADEFAIFASNFYKALEYAKNNDKFVNLTSFDELYNYIFCESINYNEITTKILLELKNKLSKGKILLSDFEILCNYIKNNIDGFISMDIVEYMIKNHAYKSNHIFDREVVKILVYSTAKDYLSRFEISPTIEYSEEITIAKNAKTHSVETETIYMDALLIDTFISGNYVELFNDLFYKMDLLKDNVLINRNELNIYTLYAVMNLVNQKTDMRRIFKDESYFPYQYMTDLKASCFVKTLRFYKGLGVDLFKSYIDSQITKIDCAYEEMLAVERKEISSEIRFATRLAKMDKTEIKWYLENFKVISYFYDDNGSRIKAIDLIKKSKNKDFIFEYFNSSVPLPETIIDDIIDLSDYKSKSIEINNLIDRLTNYIYPDIFYYSLDGFIKINMNKSSFESGEYCNELYVKISCIKESERSKKFKSITLHIIDSMK